MSGHSQQSRSHFLERREARRAVAGLIFSRASTLIGGRGGALGGEASNSRRLLPYCFRRNGRDPQLAPKYLKRWWPRAESRASKAGHAPAKRSLAANCRHLEFQFVRMVCTGLSSGVYKRSIPATYLAPKIPPSSAHVHQYQPMGLQRGYKSLNSLEFRPG